MGEEMDRDPSDAKREGQPHDRPRGNGNAELIQKKEKHRNHCQR